MTRPSLAGIERRAAAATEGPWAADRMFWKMRGSRDGWWREVTDAHGTVALLSEQDDDPETGTAEASAAFITDARTAVPALTAAVRDVLALHRPQPYGREGDPPFVPRLVCDHCLAQHDGAVEYPCPTVRALATHLDLTDPEGEPT